MIKKIGIAVISLIVAIICWLLSKFIVMNIIIGMYINYGFETAADRATFSFFGGGLIFALWLFMLWGIRKVIKKKLQ